MSTTKYAVRIPTVPGVDLLYPTQEQAAREAANARRQGHEAEVVPVEVRVRLSWNVVAA